MSLDLTQTPVDATTILDNDDIQEVYEEVNSLASKYFQLGQALHVKYGKLEEIRENFPKNSSGALNEVIAEWLKKNYMYKVAKFGEPTWKMLVEAIAKPSGGGNHALAMEVAGRHTVNTGATPAGPVQRLVHQPDQPAKPLPLVQVNTSTQQQDAGDFILSYSEHNLQRIHTDGGIQFERFNPMPNRKGSRIRLSFDIITPTQDREKSTTFGCYQMTKHPHGLAVIINNEVFAKHKVREGTEIDERNLITTFQNLGYIVEVHRDRTSHEMLKITNEASQRDHSQYDSFICCVLSHGKEGHISGSDSIMIPIKEITKHLNADSCPTLAGKPKLFFLQACRGKMKEEGVRIDCDSEDDTGSKQVMTERGVCVMTDSDMSIPETADFFFGYATPMGNVAWRDVYNGSWYVAELCRVLCQESLHASLSDMMIEVHRRVGMEYENIGYKQAPETTSRLNYDVFF